MSEQPSPPDDPTIRVVSGNPTPEELAAVTAVLSALAAEAEAESAARRVPEGQTGWAESQRALRAPLRTGPGQWTRHSA
ncbi:acyl-CoA carboxylase epsilon subunit-like protein [Frondihabitans sp. PhB188]|uniref:acyl-CoA carboxylase subunit epsilon n=1 Tax=Frondihabitans sp. PhB188 TaxID=2485200 RepID=UPI000F496CD4|nr:acyl-CoA carboxylase subunit epsilon [Frondihabitans sp. PhB188]ROQ36666.1 acyl-CoA carboxylase epsilon subunit-like protein [Frondihabitans sp. PhB188]